MLLTPTAHLQADRGVADLLQRVLGARGPGSDAPASFAAERAAPPYASLEEEQADFLRRLREAGL